MLCSCSVEVSPTSEAFASDTIDREVPSGSEGELDLSLVLSDETTAVDTLDGEGDIDQTLGVALGRSEATELLLGQCDAGGT